MKKKFGSYLLMIVIGIFAIMGVLFVLERLGWLNFGQAWDSSITVTGRAKNTNNNQIAEFSAGIETIAEDKDSAVNQANEIMNQLIAALKDYGIAAENLKIDNINVYQQDEYEGSDNPEMMRAIYPPPNTVKGDWRANLNLNIKIRPTENESLSLKSQEVLEILNNSAANYVYGPNYSLDESNIDQAELLNQAVSDARAKAEAIAKANGQKVKRILSLNEDSGYPYPVYDMAMGKSVDSSVGIETLELEPGTSSIEKTVTVTFELK